VTQDYYKVKRDRREMPMAKSHQTRTSFVERLLSSNPLVLLVGAAVSVGTVTAGVMAYLTNERITALEIQHRTEIEQIKTKDTENLLAVTTPLKEKVEDLNFRVTSIERRMPGAGPTYLDITSINVPSGSDIRKSLGPPRYTSFDNDGFFVAIPKGNWTFAATNELSYLKSMYSFLNEKVEDEPNLEKVAEAPLFIWHGEFQSSDIH
jgi:hypothetical protein